MGTVSRKESQSCIKREHSLQWAVLLCLLLVFRKKILVVAVQHVCFSPGVLPSSEGPSYDLSMAMRKLWLHPRPRTMCGRGRWKGTWSWMWLCFASDMAVCRLSRELDFMRPRVGPSAPPSEGSARQKDTPPWLIHPKANFTIFHYSSI